MLRHFITMTSHSKPPIGANKKNVNAWLKYATEMAKLGYARQVKLALEKAGKLVPAGMRSQFHFQSGRIYRLGFLLEEAVKSFKLALKDADASCEVLVSYAECLERMHRLEEGLDLLEKKSLDGKGMILKARLQRRLGYPDGVGVADDLLKNAIERGVSSSDSLLARAWHERYLLADREADYETAWSHLETSKGVIRESWGGPKLEAMLSQRRHAMAVVSETVNALGDGEIAKWVEEMDVLDVRETGFILGLPRSGTTLVEKMLLDHGSVVTTDERDVLAQLVFKPFVAEVATCGDVESDSRSLMTALGNLRSSRIKSGIKSYYQELDKQLATRTAGKLLVDKNPGYSESALMIARMVPRAKMIFPLRDLRAIFSSTWSMFPANPSEINIFWQDQESLAEWMNHTMSIWQALKQRLPSDRWLELEYEKLVAKPENEIKNVTEFLGLPSADRKKQVGKTRLDRSPSYVEVNQAPHQKSVDKWRHYESQLQIGIDLLD